MPDRTSPDWPAALERGIAERALAGETRSGDCAVFMTRGDGALVAAIDGLGHGGEAADAAELAAEVVAGHPDEDPVLLLQRCHAALRNTRGAVMTVAWFDLDGARLDVGQGDPSKLQDRAGRNRWDGPGRGVEAVPLRRDRSGRHCRHGCAGGRRRQYDDREDEREHAADGRTGGGHGATVARS